MAVIFTIGYGNRTFQDFVRLLKRYEIEYLIDVRSKPYSRINPAFSRENLPQNLSHNNVKYVFMGDVLGGRPKDPTCYTADGRVSYEEYKARPDYQAGIERLKSAWSRGLGVAIMCSELRPEQCHRSKLIGETLREMEIEVLHIDETGETKSQQQVINQIRAELDRTAPEQLPLFGDEIKHSLTSRKQYGPIRDEESRSNES